MSVIVNERGQRENDLLVLILQHLVAVVVVLDGVGYPSEVLDTVCRGSVLLLLFIIIFIFIIRIFIAPTLLTSKEMCRRSAWRGCSSCKCQCPGCWSV